MVLEVAVELPNASGDELLGYTFAGEATGADGTTYAIEGVVSDSAQNLVHIHLPALAEGTYKYALAATGQTGEREAFLAGTIGVWWAAIEEQTEPIETPNSRCTVRLPGIGRGMAHWQLTGRLEAAAIEAERQAFLASEWAQAAEEAAKSVTGGALAKQLGEVNAALKNFYDKVGNSIQANKVTKTWWIAGVDTGEQFTGDKGDMGFSPYISSRGNWVTWDENKKEAVETSIKAHGRDGIDGAAVRRIMVDKLPKLPETESEAAAHRGNFYLINGAGGYDAYALLETPNGAYSWANVGDTTPIASGILPGIAMLGTGSIVAGAPVGLNMAGGLEVGAATTVSAGVVVKSSNLANRYDTDVPTVEAVRAYLEQYYYTGVEIEKRIDVVNENIGGVSTSLSSLSTEVSAIDERVAGVVIDIATLSDSLEYCATKSEVTEAIANAHRDIAAEVNGEIFIQLSAEEYASIQPKDGVLYLIPEE